MSNNTVVFAGISSFNNSSINEKDWTKHEYGDCTYYITKKEYEHTERCEACENASPEQLKQCKDEYCLNYKYKYLVKVTDLSAVSDDEEYEDKYEIMLYHMISPESMAQERIDEVVSCCGDKDYISIVEYGTLDVLLGYKIASKDELEQYVNAAREAIQLIDSMRGFYLDKPVNRLGTDGWHIIRYALGKVDRPF